MQTIVIDPVTRIEGHAKITIHLDDDGEVTETLFHVTQLRGFEKFVEGRPYYEMPAITARICGICPISHLITSAKACEAIMCVTVPPTAVKLREIMHCGQIIQSHALSFFHLSAPDLLLGFDFDPARRNLFGVIEDHPKIARDGIALRRFGQQAIESVAGERIHPSWTVPGGVNAPLEPAARDRILTALPVAKATALRTLQMFKGIVDQFDEEIAVFGNIPTMYAGLVDSNDNMQLYDGDLRFVDAAGEIVVDRMPARDYATYIGEATVPHSFLKSPYFKPVGNPASPPSSKVSFERLRFSDPRKGGSLNVFDHRIQPTQDIRVGREPMLVILPGLV
jgi:NAD-reducing hydrogenase large subunit